MKKLVLILFALAIFGHIHSAPEVYLDSISCYDTPTESLEVSLRLTTDTAAVWGVQMILTTPSQMSIDCNRIQLETNRIPQGKGYQLRTKMLSDTTILLVLSPSIAKAQLTTDTVDLVHIWFNWNEAPTKDKRYPIVISDILMVMTTGLTAHVQDSVKSFYEYVDRRYTISASGENCTITGEGQYTYGAEAILEVTPDEGFVFMNWSDGDTSNPRTIVVTEDVELSVIVGADAATSFQTIESCDIVTKLLINDHLLIQRGDNTYDLRGARVK